MIAMRTIPSTRAVHALGFVLLTGCVELDQTDLPQSSAPQVTRSAVGPITTELGATQDTFVHGGDPFHPAADLPFLQMQLDGHHRVLVQFDAVDVDAAVGDDLLLSATLVLPIAEAAQNWTPAGGELDVHPMTTAWTDNATWTCPDDTDPSNNQPDCNPAWNHGPSANPPYDPDPTASVLVSDGEVGTLEFDVTADVLAGDISSGWIIKKALPEQPGRIRFASSESGDGPTLVLEVMEDECPGDPNKTEAGICGCGTPDDETGCLTACPVYTDPIAYLQSFADNSGTGECITETTMTCDGSTITVTGSGGVAGYLEFELDRPGLEGYSTAYGSAVACDGMTGSEWGGLAAASLEELYTCQLLFDEACESLSS